MSWRERTDLWYGTALVRPEPNSANVEHGGADVSFFVVGSDIRDAVTSLFAAIRERRWRLTSLLKMTCANDLEPDGDEEQFDPLSREADATGIALGAFYAFPKAEQLPQ